MILPFSDICNFVLQSANPPFNGIELDHSDSGREACTVTTLTITAEPNHWDGAVKVGVQEVCSTHVLESPVLDFEIIKDMMRGFISIIVFIAKNTRCIYEMSNISEIFGALQAVGEDSNILHECRGFLLYHME